MSTRQTSLSNWIMGGIGRNFGIMPSDEVDVGGVTPPRGRITPDGSYVPGRRKGDNIRSGPIKVWPSRPSQDSLKRRKQKNGSDAPRKFIA